LFYWNKPWMWEVMYLCVIGIDFVSFCDLSIGIWNCYDSVMLFYFSFCSIIWNNSSIIRTSIFNLRPVSGITLINSDHRKKIRKTNYFSIWKQCIVVAAIILWLFICSLYSLKFLVFEQTPPHRGTMLTFVSCYYYFWSTQRHTFCIEYHPRNLPTNFTFK
jgi:hypothetical protein